VQVLTVATKIKEFDPTVWVDAHGDFLFAFAFSRVRNEAAAEDLVRETLIAALQSFSVCDENSSERVWLTGILKHKIIDFWRQVDLAEDEAELSSYDYLFADERWTDHWTESTMPTEWNITPDEALEKGEFCHVLEHCLGELPARVANAFTMHEMDGLGGAEICEILQISKDNYQLMLHRARTHLRRCLEYDWFRKVNV
jgi:RNA polymerase sigma-70 factor, ECF subfamily